MLTNKTNADILQVNLSNRKGQISHIKNKKQSPVPRIQGTVVCQHDNNEHHQNSRKNNDRFENAIVSQAVIGQEMV